MYTLSTCPFPWQQLKEHIRVAAKSRLIPDATVMADFEDLLKIVKGTLDDVEHRIMCPLLQIHAYCESDNQQEVRAGRGGVGAGQCGDRAGQGVGWSGVSWGGVGWEVESQGHARLGGTVWEGGSFGWQRGQRQGHQFIFLTCVSLGPQDLILLNFIPDLLEFTPKHFQIKKNIREISRTAQRRMRDDADLLQLKHPDWLKKIKEIEHAQMLGVISCMAYGVDAIMDVDQQLDEYCAAIRLGDAAEKKDAKK